MSWQILLSISVVAMSITVLLRRALLKDAKIDPVAYFIVFQGLVGLITGVYALYRGFHLPDIQKYGLVILATMILFAAANILSVQVFRQVDASIYSVFFATSAVWIMLANRLVFHDPLTLVQFVGVVLISLSILILVYKNGVFKLDRGTKLGLFMGFLLGLASTCWVYVSRHSDIPT